MDGSYAANMVKAMRDASLYTIHWVFAHKLQVVVRDGVLSQQAVMETLAGCQKLLPTAYGQLHRINHTT